MCSVNVFLLLVSTERDKDIPDVEVTESAPAEVVATYVSWELLLPSVNEVQWRSYQDIKCCE